MKWMTLLALLLSLLVAAPVQAADQPDARLPRVVATTEVLGSIVRELAADAADVTVLMSGGVDPHSWQPSARDTETVFGADLIVANGLDLEEGLVSVLEQAETDGIRVFHATDHVDLRASAGAEPEPTAEADATAAVEDAATAQPTHEHATGDPHFWLDPLAMRDVVVALGPAMTEAGVQMDDRVATVVADLESLDTRIRDILSVVPEGQRQLVTGHGALGYFADRYGFRIIGTVIPGLSTSDEPSARDIADLVEAIRAAGTTAVFTDVGTPPAVAEAVASETGARLVELNVAQLPESGRYDDLLLQIATAVAEALSGT